MSAPTSSVWIRCDRCGGLGVLRRLVLAWDKDQRTRIACPVCKGRRGRYPPLAGAPGSDSSAMKYYLLQHGDDRNTLHAFDTPTERDAATIRAIFGEDITTQDEANAWDIYRDELNDRGRLSFEGDPGLEWFTAWPAGRPNATGSATEGRP